MLLNDLKHRSITFINHHYHDKKGIFNTYWKELNYLKRRKCMSTKQFQIVISIENTTKLKKRLQNQTKSKWISKYSSFLLQFCSQLSSQATLSVSSKEFFLSLLEYFCWFNELNTGDIVCEGVGGGSDACSKYCRDLGSGYTGGQCNASKTCQCYWI